MTAENNMREYLESQLEEKLKRAKEDAQMFTSLVECMNLTREVTVLDYQALMSYNRGLIELAVLLKMYNDNFNDENKRKIQDDIIQDIKVNNECLIDLYRISCNQWKDIKDFFNNKKNYLK